MSYGNSFSFPISFSPFESSSLFPTKCYLELLSKVLRITFYLFKIFYPIRFSSQIPFEKWKWKYKEVSSKKWAQLSLKISNWAQKAKWLGTLRMWWGDFVLRAQCFKLPSFNTKGILAHMWSRRSITGNLISIFKAIPGSLHISEIATGIFHRELSSMSFQGQTCPIFRFSAFTLNHSIY